MSIASVSVQRPVLISMLACVVLILGGVALKYLPIDLMPDITVPVLSINTTYEDASPEEMEELITRPIEQSVSAVSGVKTISSTSGEGVSNITLEFNWGVDLDVAVADVRDRLDRTIKGLPDDADRPIIRKFDSANFPIMRLGIGTEMDLLDARKLVEDQVQYRFERVNGVASADVGGGYTREIQIRLDPDKAKTLEVTLADVLSKIRSNNVTTPAGNLQEERLEIRVRTPGTYASLDELRNTVISTRNGQLIRIKDIAEVADTHEEVTNYVRVNGKPGIFIQIYKQSGANTVAVAKGVLEEIEKINADMHQLDVRAIFNSADYIEQSLSNVSDSAIYGGILAVLVLLFFLRNIRSTLIIAISIPMSIVATFALIYFCGFTLNIMTLGGLALGIGMLVDNSIVVLENITRLHDSGMSKEEAARQGTDEVLLAILASTLTTLAVFLPLIFTEGIAGIMFKQLSAVVGFSLMCSYFAAVSLVPMLASKLMTESIHHENENSKTFFGRLLVFSSHAQDALDKFYSSLLEQVLHHRILAVATGFGLILAVAPLCQFIGSEMMPKSDGGAVNINLEGAVGTRAEEVNAVVLTYEDMIRNEIESEYTGMVSSAGGSSWRGTGSHKGSFNLRLKPRTERERSSEDIAVKLGKMLKDVPGFTFRVTAQSGMRMGGGGSDAITADLRGYDLDTGNALAARLKELAEKVPGVTDVELSRELGVPEQRIVIDRDKAANLQISVQTIADSLRTVLAGSSAGEYRDDGDEYTILVKVKDADELPLERILDMTIRNAAGEKVTLRNLVSYKSLEGPVNIGRKNQERVVTLTINFAERDMGSVVTDLQEAFKQVILPESFSLSFSGDYEDQQEAFRDLTLAFVLALLLVYMVMACQFESLRDPLVVMFSVPLAAIGVILTLLWTNTTFNVQSFIGCIMLAGIVVNNAILLVDTTNLLRNRDHMDMEQAIREAGRRRLRPILMTTLTTVLGLLPLAFGWGEGGENQAPLARAVIGGLASSTVITLFFIPALYSIMERSNRKQSKAEQDSLN